MCVGIPREVFTITFSWSTHHKIVKTCSKIRIITLFLPFVYVSIQQQAHIYNLECNKNDPISWNMDITFLCDYYFIEINKLRKN